MSMLGKVRFENYEKCYPKRLKKFFQSDINYRTYNKFIPKMERAVVGNLPPELIRFFPKETRADNIKRFQQILGEIACFLRKTFSDKRWERDFKYYDKNYRASKYMTDIAAGGEDLLNARLGASSGGGQINAELKYIEHGGFANVYRLALRNNNGEKIIHDKALKVFNALQEPLPEYKYSHNNYAEANLWIYLKRAAGHRLDNTQITRHYISDMDNGYALTEFIDPDISKTKSILNICQLLKLYPPRDFQCNPLIMGKLYDIGGFEKKCDFMDDKVVLRYFKKLFFRSEKDLPEVLTRIEALAQNPKTPHRNKIQKAIELFKKQKGINNNKL